MMTKQQKATVELLRKEGMTYREIGEKIGVSTAVVKMYFYRQQHQLVKPPLCDQCHKPINATVFRKNRRFCSPECKAKWWSLHTAAERAKAAKDAGTFLKSVTEPTSCSLEVLISGKSDLGDGITGYIASMAISGVMLNRKIISKQEFFDLEKQLLAKYGLPENSIYRDYRIVKVTHSKME